MESVDLVDFSAQVEIEIGKSGSRGELTVLIGEDIQEKALKL